MNVTHNMTGTLRAQMQGRPPLVFDARGNGGGNNLPIVLETNQDVDGGIAFTLDTMHRQQAVMTYQRTAGTLNPGAHPGSYNGQDAYNDMLVVDDGDMGNGNRTGKCRNHEGGGVRP